MDLVTGANGFVGAAVVRKLLDRGRSVRAMVRRDSDCRNLEGLDVERVTADLTDPGTLRAAVDGCSSIFHVAADYRLWTLDADAMYATNIQGSLAVLELAAQYGVDRLVYTSSVAVLGTHADRSPADEESPVSIDDMIGPYKRSKFLAEKSVRARAAELSVPLVVVNPSTPIGPGDFKPTPTGKIIVDAACGRMPAFVDTGLNVVHVDDVAEGHLLAHEKGKIGERYILGGSDLSLKEILELVARHAGRKAPRLRLPRWSVYPVAWIGELVARGTRREPMVTLDGLRMASKYMYFSSAKARQQLGYSARPSAEAINDAIDWFRQHGLV